MFYLPIAVELARQGADQVANNDRTPHRRRRLHRVADGLLKDTNVKSRSILSTGREA